MDYDVIIVGAGPGGLACGKVTASHGLSTLIIERNNQIGRKVCAGGITWNGLLREIDQDISENQFRTQHIFTRNQKVSLSARDPIIATVNRQVLGQYMLSNAQQVGVEVLKNTRVVSIQPTSLDCIDDSTGRKQTFKYKTLVGADGSTSIVRRSLHLSTDAIGVGINHQIPEVMKEMQWHLDSHLFKSGYAWVFPHKYSTSIGAYVDSRIMKPKLLQKNFKSWACSKGFELHQSRGQAEFINFDFKGYHFGNRYLIGDAAGLASGLTGEGIYPAIVSGQEIAKEICGSGSTSNTMRRLMRNHRKHKTMVSLAGKNDFLSSLLTESVTFFLKHGIINFSSAEMAH